MTQDTPRVTLSDLTLFYCRTWRAGLPMLLPFALVWIAAMWMEILA